MTEQEIAAYKEQMFGSNGQSSTQSPPPPPQPQPPAEEKKPVTTTEEKPPVKEEVPTPKEEEEEILDEEVFLERKFGVKNADEIKSAFQELNSLKESAKTKKEIEFANEQSRLLYEAVVGGKTDEALEILDTQKKLSAVNNMKDAEAIKLHIAQTKKHYRPVDIEDVFDEKYSYPEKPIRLEMEEDDDYKSRIEKWQASKEKIDRRIERDAADAKIELSKLSAELKLPEIPKPKQEQPATSSAEDEAELARLSEETKQAYSKFSPKDVSMVFKFNDEASKLAFDIAYEPDKESFEQAKGLASDMAEFFKSYYDKDGSPLRKEFLKDIYAGRNINKIVSEAIVQAVNQARIDFLKKQKNIGDGTQRQFVLPPVTDIDKLKQQVFG